MRPSTRLLATLVPFALCAPLLAQGGFTPGELILYSPTVYGGSISDGALLRIDPVSGQVTPLIDLTGSSQSKAGSMAYDPYRDRVIFVGAFPAVNDPVKLWLSDALGNTTDLGIVPTSYYDFAPASGGRIYFRTGAAATPYQYLDESNVVHTLMDSSGTQPFTHAVSDVQTMVYDPGTNALFMAVQSSSAWNCGTTSKLATVHRVPLSVDGSRVEGPIDCTLVPVDPNSSNVSVGFNRGPDGQLLIVVDTNSISELPRMSLIDPLSLAVSPWATSGYNGAAAVSGGTWSTLLARAVIFDSFGDVLRAYAQGDTGAGTPIVPSSPISTGGFSGEIASLVEIPLDPGALLVGQYCTAKVNSSGCTPTLSTSGKASASAPSGFTLTCTQVEAGNVGIFFYGQGGPNATAFQGGTLCVQPPTWRLPPQVSIGFGTCGAAYAIDFNSYVASGADPSLLTSSIVHGQFWFRDPPHPVSGTGLSGGVTFTLCP